MGSVIDFTECPHCKQEAHIDYYYKTREEYLVCMHCGYYKSYTIKNRDKKLTEFTLNRLKHWYGKDILNSLLEVLHYVDEDDLKSIVKMLGEIGLSAASSIIKQFSKANSELKIIYLRHVKVEKIG